MADTTAATRRGAAIERTLPVHPARSVPPGPSPLAPGCSLVNRRRCGSGLVLPEDEVSDTRPRHDGHFDELAPVASARPVALRVRGRPAPDVAPRVSLRRARARRRRTVRRCLRALAHRARRRVPCRRRGEHPSMVAVARPLARSTTGAGRAPAAPSGARPRLRSLVECVMRELRGEFDRAIQRKLAQLMGDLPLRIRRSGAARGRGVRSCPPWRSTGRRSASGSSPYSPMVARVRGVSCWRTRIFEDEAPTVVRELRDLRAAGKVRIQGPRGSARWVLTRVVSAWPARGPSRKRMSSLSRSTVW